MKEAGVGVCDRAKKRRRMAVWIAFFLRFRSRLWSSYG